MLSGDTLLPSRAVSLFKVHAPPDARCRFESLNILQVKHFAYGSSMSG